MRTTCAAMMNVTLDPVDGGERRTHRRTGGKVALERVNQVKYKHREPAVDASARSGRSRRAACADGGSDSR
jgi:hypothetical protein